MKVFRVTLQVLAGVVFLTTVKWASAQTEPVALAIDGIDFKDAGPDRVRLEIHSHVTADRKLKISRVVFEHMRLGSIPIYLSPIEEHLELEKATPTTLPRIPVTVYFRDLDSLEPLQQAVNDRKATVKGKARAELDLSILERIAARQWKVQVDMPIEMTIPVQVPGGVTGQTAALAALRAAQFALNVGGSALNSLRQSQKRWEQELRSQYVPSLLVAESRFSLRLKDNQVDYVVHGLGFRISEDKFVLTDEMVEPWKYDADVAAAFQSGEAALVPNSSNVLVWPGSEAGAATEARALSNGQIQLQHKSDEMETRHISADGKNVKVRVSKRDSNANRAIFRFTRDVDKGTAIQLAPEGVRHVQNWDRLSLFRVDDKGKLELVSMPARRQDDRITLEDPIDERAFGSPLTAPEGAVGMMQEERAGMILAAKW